MRQNQGLITDLIDPRVKALIQIDSTTELAERSLHDYLKLVVWPVIEPVTPFHDNWHIGYLCEYLEAVTAGQILRLVINIPPRFLKSILCTIAWPTWEWIRKPELRFACASYADDLALDHSKLRRQIIQSPIYQDFFGKSFSLVRDNNQAGQFSNDKSGMMLATSVGGTFTGKGGDRIIFDDITNPKQAESTVERLKGIEFYRNTAFTRLNNYETGAIVIPMQRLHHIDLSSYVLSQEVDGNFTHICLQACATERKTYSYPI